MSKIGKFVKKRTKYVWKEKGTTQKHQNLIPAGKHVGGNVMVGWRFFQLQTTFFLTSIKDLKSTSVYLSSV